MTTKTDMLDLLRRDPMTVPTLCLRLGLTRNAINVQLRQLEAEGLVRRQKAQLRGNVGKPATVYEAAPGSEDASSGAYQTFLVGLVSTLKTTLSSSELGDALEQTGRQIARDAGLAKPRSFEEGLQAAMAAADAMGASTEATVCPGGVMVRNYSCPVGSAVREDACVCRALASFFSESTGHPATERCLRGERLVCQYFIEVPKRPIETAGRRKPHKP